MSEKIILNINKQLEAKVLGKRLNSVKKKSEPSHVSETYALIQVRKTTPRVKIAKKNKDKENEKKGTGLKKEQGEENTGQGKGREEKCVIFFRTILA